MQEIEGRLYDGRTSSSRPAKLAGYVDGTVRLSWQGGEQSFRVDALDIPPGKAWDDAIQEALDASPGVLVAYFG